MRGRAKCGFDGLPDFDLVEESARPAVVDHVGDLAAREPEIDGQRDRADTRRGEYELEVGAAIAQQDADPVAGRDAVRGQPARRSRDARLEGRPVEAPVVVRHGEGARPALCPTRGPVADVVQAAGHRAVDAIGFRGARHRREIPEARRPCQPGAGCWYPPGMVEDAVARSIAALGLAGERILVAVSGGIDSCVLLAALARRAPALGVSLCVGHVDHGLRGAESEADAAFVAGVAESLGLPVGVEHAPPGPLRESSPKRDRPTLQEAARTVRYAALDAIAGRLGADRIATAHTLDDQAETVLMRLLRGTGPEGLGGIREVGRGGRLLRPLLSVSRADIAAYAAAHGIGWREDSSNAATHYTRNKLRHDWIPRLRAEFNPQLLRAIGNLAEAQRRESDWMSEQVDAVAARLLRKREDGIEIDAGEWSRLPDALVRRLIARALAELGAGRDVSRVHLERAIAFLRCEKGDRVGAAIELPGGLRLMRRSGAYHLGPPRV